VIDLGGRFGRRRAAAATALVHGIDDDELHVEAAESLVGRGRRLTTAKQDRLEAIRRDCDHRQGLRDRITAVLAANDQLPVRHNADRHSPAR
jgi:hypothetical protein